MKILTASLLVAGTAIGAGMLALPIATGSGGFIPACFLFFLCWLFMASTGLCLLEACLWFPRDSNIVTLSTHLLGKKGKIASWVLYIFFFYCLTIAYVAGGGGFLRAVFPSLPAPLSILCFTAIFSPFIYIGTKAVDRINVLLMVGLIVSFFVFILVGWGHVEFKMLERANWSTILFSLPIAFASFGYQGIVPSLTTYFEGNGKNVRKVILIGSFIPLLVYLVWEALILGIVPLEGLQVAKIAQETAVSPLKHFVASPYVYAAGQAFAFFALTTSFLGVTLGLFDFLADGLKWEKKGTKKLALFAIVFAPPTVIAMINTKIFITALNYAGGFGSAFLLGLLPVLMVWSGRYHKKLDQKYQILPGGRKVLIVLILFVVFELFVELVGELSRI